MYQVTMHLQHKVDKSKKDTSCQDLWDNPGFPSKGIVIKRQASWGIRGGGLFYFFSILFYYVIV